MENPTITYESQGHHPLGFITGLLLGGLAGAVALLLVAPQSGEKTRGKIQKKGKQLRDQTVEAVEDVMTQARSKANQITTEVHNNVEELKQRGQEVLDDQKERLATAVESGNAVIQSVLD
jgi:gas vesicle protein